MQPIILRTALLGRTVRTTLFGAQAGQRWLFRRNRGWLGGDRVTDRSVLWICTAFVLMGLALMVNQESNFLSVTSPARWPTISARIVAVQVDERHAAHGVDWVPRVTYRYSIAGRQYQSSRVSVVPLHWSSRDEANAFLARYLGHTDVLAYYNPRQPDQAILEQQDGLIDTAIFAGALLIALAFGTLTIYIRLR